MNSTFALFFFIILLTCLKTVLGAAPVIDYYFSEDYFGDFDPAAEPFLQGIDHSGRASYAALIFDAETLNMDFVSIYNVPRPVYRAMNFSFGKTVCVYYSSKQPDKIFWEPVGPDDGQRLVNGDFMGAVGDSVLVENNGKEEDNQYICMARAHFYGDIAVGSLYTVELLFPMPTVQLRWHRSYVFIFTNVNSVEVLLVKKVHIATTTPTDSMFTHVKPQYNQFINYNCFVPENEQPVICF